MNLRVIFSCFHWRLFRRATFFHWTSFIKNCNTVYILISLGGIIKFANSKEVVVKWLLNKLFQCKYVEALKYVTNTSNAVYTLSQCTQPEGITKSNENIFQTKNIIVFYFYQSIWYWSSLRTNLTQYCIRYNPLEIIQDFWLSVKDAGRLKEWF